MPKLEDLLRPHSIEAVCAADRAAGKKHILIDVSGNTNDSAAPSLELLKRKVERLIGIKKKRVRTATKLYIVGDWSTAEPGGEQNERQKILGDALEWETGVDTVRKVIRRMRKLKELVWTSGLPFMASVFEDLPTKLTKLVLDLSHHVSVVDNGVTLTKLHIRPGDMMPLLKQTRLVELRLLGLRDSLQLIAWKTVYLNQMPGGMRILELQMNAMPIIRNDNNKWHKALDVRGLTVAQPGLLEKPYKGRDGKGGLHWSFGYGEYLDGDCIRKARITSGVEQAISLPLQCLRLDGFVIDHLPFEHELTDIVLLTCGEKCIDAGVRAPRTQAEPYNPWSKKVNNAACRILIQWPNWTGIFDTEGDQRDTHGDVVSQEAGLSTPYMEDAPLPPPQLPLTEKALSNVSKGDYFNIPPTLQPPPDALPDTVSDHSERGSEVLTTNELFAVDSLPTYESDSTNSFDVLDDDVASDFAPEEASPTLTSRNSGSESDGPSHHHRVRKSLSDSYWVLGPS